MNTEELSRLIDRYYAGESSEEEELVLRDFFKNGIVPAGFETEKAIFSYEDKKLGIPGPSADFESRILAAIDDLDTDSKGRKHSRSILPYLSIAASLLIITASYFFFIDRSKTVDTYNDPAIAYAETIRILRDVSAKLNSGTRALQPVGKLSEITSKSLEPINRSSAILGKNLKTLDYLQQAIEIGNVSDKDNK